MKYEKKKVVVKEEGAPWLLTYGDMVTLLLVFFVFIFASATIDVQKFRELSVSLRGALGNLRGGERVVLPSDLPRPDPEAGEPVAIKSLVQAIPRPEEDKEEKETEKDFKNKGVNSGEGKVVNKLLTEQVKIVTVPNIEMFDDGKIEIKPRFKEFLRSLYDLIGYYENNKITIVGRPDRIPLESSIYPHNNWELASARALAVLNYYTGELKVSNDHFTVMAYARYSEDQRMIDIIFHPNEESR